jgi:hypothetical protein
VEPRTSAKSISDVQLNAAWSEFLAAGSDRLGFFSRGCESQEPNQLAAHATEGVMTNLKAGRTRQVAKYAMHDTQRAMPFGQNFSPELLGFRLIAK